MTESWLERFDRFTTEKTRLASRAALPPYVTTNAAPPRDAIAIGNVWTERVFDGSFFVSPPLPHRPSCSLVFVQSADGNTGARDPSSLGGGDTDKHVIYEGLSRVAADAVLSGAETIRGGSTVLSVWHPELVALRTTLGKPRHPIQVVATLRGLDLESGLLYNVPDLRVILVTVREAADRMAGALRARPWIEVITMAGPSDLTAAFARLRAMGVTTLSCIGGRTLARGLLDARLVDDVYLTTAARPGGEPGTPLTDRPLRGDVLLSKRGTGVETGVTFDHLRQPIVDPRV